jgi:glycosyltransferase involved in cell wall biosynthesis
MDISVIVIARNEATTIGALLSSVSWAREVIVVDCGSSDGTQEIAQNSGAKVLYREFDDFAQQKNFAQSAASFPWVLNLDADERCTPELRNELARLGDGGADGYLIPRRNYFQGRWIRHCGWYPDYKLRLYRRDLGNWQGLVHESVHLPALARTIRLHAPIEHHTYKGFDRYLGSLQQFARLAALQMRRQGRTGGFPDLLLRPPAAFLKKFILQFGFLDGSRGFMISALSAYATFCRFCYLTEPDSQQDIPKGSGLLL